MRNVKVWAGVHPDEKAALAVADSLKIDPIPNVSRGIANPLARFLGRRFVDKNLNYSFPGNPDSPVYEERRAAEVIKQSLGYAAVIDMHNMIKNGINTAFIDKERGVDSIMLGFLGKLGIRNLALTDFGGLHGNVFNGIALETSANGIGRDIQKIRMAIDDLANDPQPILNCAEDFSWYRYFGSAHIDQFDPSNLSIDEQRKIDDFNPLPEHIATHLGFDDLPILLYSWRYEPNEHGFWGELVTPSSVPDTANWPN